MAGFDFEVQFRPGRQNPADGLCRRWPGTENLPSTAEVPHPLLELIQKRMKKLGMQGKHLRERSEGHVAKKPRQGQLVEHLREGSEGHVAKKSHLSQLVARLERKDAEVELLRENGVP